MDKSLAAQRTQYAAEGATIIPAVLPPEWLEDTRGMCASLACDAERRIHDSADGEFAGPIGKNAIFVSTNGTRYWQYLSRDNPDFFNQVADARLTSAVSAVTGISDLRLWYEEIYMKQPGAEGTGWHQDVASFHFKGDDIPIGWIPLCDTDASNSPMCTIIGSHLARDVLFHPRHNRDPNLRLPGYKPTPDFTQMLGADLPGCRVWELKAGDILLINPYTVHCSLNNNSAVCRASISIRWLGERLKFQPDGFTFVDPWLSDVPEGQLPLQRFPLVSCRSPS